MSDIVEVVKNRRTGALYVMLDESASNFQVIHPDGKIVSLPTNLFEEDPILLRGDAAGQLTAAQREALAKHQQELRAQAEHDAEIERKARQRDRAEEARAEARPKPRPLSSARAPREKPDKRVGLGNTWTSPTLTFYRNRIDPLGPKQSFRIIIGPEKLEFEIKKEEFQKVFNDVVMSEQYRQHFYYTFRELPERALRYIKQRT